MLDDLFLARKISDAAGELLQALVHQRYKLKRSIVVTSIDEEKRHGKISRTTPSRIPGAQTVRWQ